VAKNALKLLDGHLTLHALIATYQVGHVAT
jgi:hypothetical protein